VHPLLIGAFPVVFLFAQNINEQFSLSPLWQPLALAIGGAALVLLIAIGIGLAVGSIERAALAASLLILLAMTYGHAWNLVGDSLRMHRYLLVPWALLAIIGIVIIWRIPAGAVRRATMIVTIFAAALIVVNAVPIAELAVRSASVVGPANANAEPSGEPTAGEGRDVWYIVPDRYGGANGLAGTYGFDNTPFLDALRDRGFEVADDATATYLKTALSLLATLNLDELDFDSLETEAAGGDDFGPIHRRLQGSTAVERFLHERGYRYLHVGSVLGPTAGNAAADEVFLYGSTTEFGTVLAETTLLRSLERITPRAIATTRTELITAQTEFQFETLPDLADAPGRNFVFAHLLVPHPPYVWNADGSRVTDEQKASRSVDEQYIEQLKFTNARLLALVDRLHAGPPETWPIIVISADEGPFPNAYAQDEKGYQWLEAPPDDLLRKFSVLSAISIPGVDRADLEDAGFSDDLTLVNLFRIVLNAAFDADLSMLPGRHWVFLDQTDLYDEVDITDRIPEDPR
jgi:hypothetical protein